MCILHVKGDLKSPRTTRSVWEAALALGQTASFQALTVPYQQSAG